MFTIFASVGSVKVAEAADSSIIMDVPDSDLPDNGEFCRLPDTG